MSLVRLKRLEKLRLRFLNMLDQKIGKEKKVLKKYIQKLEYYIDEEKKTHDRMNN